MHAGAFELIATNAGGGGRADFVEVVVKEFVGTRTHGQVRRGNVFEQNFCAADDGNGTVQLVRAAAQCRKLFACRASIGGFGKSPRAERERLIRAQHQPPCLTRSNGERLLARQQHSDFAGGGEIGTRLDGAFVDR